jgi:hypothetical protein
VLDKPNHYNHIGKCVEAFNWALSGRPCAILAPR